MDRVSILGVNIDNVCLEEAVHRAESFVNRGEPLLVVTANPEMIMLARRDRSFRLCLESAGMVTADGIGLIIAARLLGRPLKERVTGIDLVSALFRRTSGKKPAFYFAGGLPGIAEKAAANVREAYPGVEIAGVWDGYFEDDTAIIEDIQQKKPDIVLAGLGMGKQEKWLKERVLAAGVPVGIGVGGSFDVLAGAAKRAPGWMRRLGLEWFYRLVRQPSRFGRMLQLPRFLLAVVLSRFTAR